MLSALSGRYAETVSTMSSFSMNAISVASCLPTLPTTTSPELTCLWARTRRIQEPSSRQAWERSWSYPKSVACITATSAAPPDRDKGPSCRHRHRWPSLCSHDDPPLAPTAITRPALGVRACERASTLLVFPIHPGSPPRRRPDERLAKDTGLFQHMFALRHLSSRRIKPESTSF